MPPPPPTSDIESARKKANLRVLQRLDPSILDVAGSATHVVLYEFSESDQRWEKRNVEGSLFLAKRSSVPRFKLIVLNRNSTENLEVNVTETFQMQVREPYLIFREGTSRDRAIRGIWFHDDSERNDVSELLEKVVKSEARAAELEVGHSTSVSGSGVGATTTMVSGGGGGGGGGGDSVGSGGAATSGSAVDAGAAASALLSPLTLKDQSTSTRAASPAPQQQQQQQQQHNHNNHQGHGHGSHHRNLVLDKKSLQLSLMSLIQDERFLDLIHAQYLKVAHARANKDGGGSGGGGAGGERGAHHGDGDGGHHHRHGSSHSGHGGGGGGGGGSASRK